MDCLLDASETYEKGPSSSFGGFLGFVNQGTLQAIRKFWASYATTNDSEKVRNHDSVIYHLSTHH